MPSGQMERGRREGEAAISLFRVCFFVLVWFNGFVVVVACSCFHLLACLLCCVLFHGGGLNRDKEGVCWDQEENRIGVHNVNPRKIQ